MLILDLICTNRHVFEAWFPNREAFSRQKACGLVSCSVCGDAGVEVVPGGKPVVKKGSQSDVAKKREDSGPANLDPMVMIKYLNHYMKTQCENVGEKFPEEARKMYHGEIDPKNIYGTATEVERVELKEEGVPFFSVPKLPDEINN